MSIVDKLIDDLILELAGKDVVKLVNLIKNKNNVSEFKLAAKLDITVNQARNMLYKLNNYNLVDFTRKKDKTKGWYIYFWTFNIKLAKDLAVSMKKNKINILRKRLEKESLETYFICPNDCVRFDSTNAMEYQFKCPECAKVLVKEDNLKNVDKINKELTSIEKELKELQELEEKQQKSLERKLEKARQKEKERKLRKKKRAQKKRSKQRNKTLKKKDNKKKNKLIKKKKKFKK